MSTQTDLEAQGSKIFNQILMWFGVAAVAIVVIWYFTS